MLRFLVGSAAFVIVIAGMRAASAIVVPFLFSLFLAILLAAPLRWMRRRGIGTIPALLLIGAGITLIGGSLLAVGGDSITEFAGNLPEYREQLHERVIKLLDRARSFGLPVPKGTGRELFNADKIVDWVGSLLGGLGGILANSLLVTFTAIFLLLEASGFATKLQNMPGQRGQDMLVRAESVVENVQRYIGIKAMISLISGTAVAAGLSLLGVPNAVLWGLLAFATNFIPNIGAFLAGTPAVLTVLLDSGLAQAAAVLGVFLVVEFVTGYLLEPWWAGKSVGLSTLVVFLSLVFWGWVLGPAGMLLSVPLTMTLKIALESMESTRWIAVMLSEAPDEKSTTSASAGNS